MAKTKYPMTHELKTFDLEQELKLKIAALLGEEMLAVEEIILRFSVSTAGAMQDIISYVLQSRGKRLRPLLVLLSAFKGGKREALHRTAAAVELIHTASLLHDDVIDGARTRRGNASLNALRGNFPAVLAGDYFFARAFALVAYCNNITLISLFAAAISTICEAELEQTRNAFNCNMGEQQYLRCAYGKTAALMEACCEAGALLSALDRDAMQQLKLYGRNLGMAFQITDDLLDIQGNPAFTGKPVGSDLREGTITLPLIYILEDSRWGEYLCELIRTRDFSPAKLSFLADPACLDGPLARARQRAAAYAADAANCLHRLEWTPGREILEDLLFYVLRRNK